MSFCKPIEKILENNFFDVTSSRYALDGYQKGKCFYCFDDISIEPSDDNLADVDHFFPYILETSLQRDLNIHGVWNLVLSCNSCIRGGEWQICQSTEPEVP